MQLLPTSELRLEHNVMQYTHTFFLERNIPFRRFLFCAHVPLIPRFNCLLSKFGANDGDTARTVTN